MDEDVIIIPSGSSLLKLWTRIGRTLQTKKDIANKNEAYPLISTWTIGRPSHTTHGLYTRKWKHVFAKEDIPQSLVSGRHRKTLWSKKTYKAEYTR